MRVILHLALNHLNQRRVRSLLTVGAIAISVGLVITMTSGMASLRAAAYQDLNARFGALDVVAKPQQVKSNALIGAALIERWRQDERVRRVDRRLEWWPNLMDAEKELLVDHPVRAIGVIRVGADPETALPIADGRWFADDATRECVITQSLATRTKLKAGDSLWLASQSGLTEMKIVGVATKPALLWAGGQSVYMPIAEMERQTGHEGEATRVEIDLKEGIDADAFAEEWKAKTAGMDPVVRFQTQSSKQKNFDRAFVSITAMGYLGSSVSMIAAMFIIFSTVSMGVTERTRTLAMLRSIGAARPQVAGLVLAEGVLLGAAGGIAGLGVGALILWIMYAGWSHLFVAGLQWSTGGLIMGIGGSLGAAVVASALPAFWAARRDPLEAMAVAARAPRPWLVWVVALAGAALVCVDPLICHGLPYHPDSLRLKLLGHMFIGFPCTMLGLFALAPVLVLVVERLFAGPVARLLGLPAGLLRHQLSGGLWRTAGTAAALMVGLTALVSIQAAGRSTAAAWELPARFPDLVVMSFGLTGLELKDVEKVESLPGVEPDSVAPVVLVQPKTGAMMRSLGGLLKVPETTMMFGVDTWRAFGSEKDGREPMIGLQFVSGTLADAQAKLAAGRHILISEEFHRLKNKDVGDTVDLITDKSGKVTYTVAGVVRSGGADMILRMFNMENEFDSWTTAAVLTDMRDVTRDFGPQRTRAFVLNVDKNKDDADLQKSVRQALGAWGLHTRDVRELKGRMMAPLYRLTNMVSLVAIVALLIAALGVTNTMAASVRSRRWQLGVLRSQGLTRQATIRLILAEAVLIGSIATIMGIAGGLSAFFNGNRVALEIFSIAPPLNLGWGVLATGAAITIGTATIASLWPAVQVAWTQVLQLLKADRSAT